MDTLSGEDITWVRMLTSDLGSPPIMSDAEIFAIAAHESSLKLVAARILDIIATTEVLLAKKLTTQDLTTDGPAVAAALRKQAEQLRREDAEDRLAPDAGDPVVFRFIDGPRRPEATEWWSPW